jgi:5-(carboxyamino)imidazole ribonucleotide mutase
MPSGIPVATMSINGAKNAAIFIAEIFALSDKDIKEKLIKYREKMVSDVEAKAKRVEQQLNKD